MGPQTDPHDLIDAIRNGDEERALALVRREPDLADAHDADGLSVALLAVYHGHERAAEAIAAAKIELDVFEAAALGRVERLRDLLDADSGLARTWTADGFTALHYAAFFDGPEAARVLLEAGADASAVARNEQLEVQPIHSAAASRQAETVRLLLEHGADANARERGGGTPLHAAAQNGDDQTVRILLDAGADAALAHPDGRTAADVAREAGHDHVASRLAQTV